MNKEELSKLLQGMSKKWEIDEQKTALAKRRNKENIDELVELINNILNKNGISEKINRKQISFYLDFIGNIFPPIEDKLLSQLIFDKCFPVPEFKQYYHFTSIYAVKNIINTGKLRLSNLRTRFEDGEYIEFDTDHGMKRGEERVFGVDCTVKSIMKDIFFFSFTSDSYGEDKWRDFGDNGEGVRLEFSVTPKHNNFREVYYSLNKNANCIPLLKDLFTEIQKKYNHPFNFTYSSTIGAFYIKGKYANENEYRFLVKTTADAYSVGDLQPVITDAEDQKGYIEIPLSNKFGEFKILSIQPGHDCDEADIEELKSLVADKDPHITVHNKARKNIFL